MYTAIFNYTLWIRMGTHRIKENKFKFKKKTGPNACQSANGKSGNKTIQTLWLKCVDIYKYITAGKT